MAKPKRKSALLLERLYKEQPLEVPALYLHEWQKSRVHVYALYDIHFGARQTRYNALRRAVKTIQEDKYAVVVLGGDNFEAIDLQDWRALASKLDAFPKEMTVEELPNSMALAFNGLVDILSPIKKKIIAVLEGNHEQKYERGHGFSLTGLLARELDAEFLGYEGVVSVPLSYPEDSEYRRVILNTVFTHGWGGGRYKGAKINRATQYASWWNGAHAIFAGHSHDPVEGPVAINVIGKPFRKGVRITRRVIQLIRCPSFRGDARYAVKSGLPPPVSGYVWLEAYVHVKTIRKRRRYNLSSRVHMETYEPAD